MVNTKKSDNANKSIRTTLRDIPDATGGVDFGDFKTLISELEKRALDINIFTEKDEDDLVRSLLAVRDSEGYISNVKVQDMFGIDHKAPVSEDQLRTFGVPFFLTRLREYLLGGRVIGDYVDNTNTKANSVLAA